MTTQLTINSTGTVQKLKEMGASIVTRNSNHHVKFYMNGKLYEIEAKNNRDYCLNLLSSTNEDYKKEVAVNPNPLTLIDSLN